MIPAQRRRRLALLFFAVLLLSGLYFRPYRVEGSSMQPAYSAGDWVLTVPLWRTPKRGDLVIFDAPEDAGRSMKRVSGLPGESAKTAWQTIAPEDGRNPIETSRQIWGSDSEGPPDLPPDHYFLLGDHLADSIDSRHYGPVSREAMRRRVVARLFAAEPTDQGETSLP